MRVQFCDESITVKEAAKPLSFNLTGRRVHTTASLQSCSLKYDHCSVSQTRDEAFVVSGLLRAHSS